MRRQLVDISDTVEKVVKDPKGGVAVKELQEGDGVKQWNWGDGERWKAEQGM